MLRHLIKFALLSSWLLPLMFSSQASAQAQTFSCSNVTEIPQVECEELVTLYNTTNGANWKTKNGWLSTNTPCSWFGITCTTNHHVRRISLSHDGSSPMEFLGNNLSGTIPNLNLPELIYLDLDNNQLSGSIPNFSNLPALRGLYLRFNQLSGSIPNFSNLPTLEILQLSGNHLTGNIPNFTNLPKLFNVGFGYNNLTGNIPNFVNSPSITYLYLDHNHLTGSIPNVNWSTFLVLLLNNNCGLVAFDAAQAAVLSKKDPKWQQLNSVCINHQIYLPLIVK